MNNSLKLIDTFPLETRKSYVRDNIKRGLVVKAYFPGAASYDKYFVFMGLSADYQTGYGFFINSERHPLSEKRYFVLRAQIQLDPGSYGFLKNPDPSFIDSFAPYPFDFSNILTALIECPSKICGHLSPEHLEEVIRVVHDNRTLTPEQNRFLTGTFTLPSDFLA